MLTLLIPALTLTLAEPPKVLWRVALRSEGKGSACIGHVDADGVPEVIFGTSRGESRLLVLRGDTGAEVWSSDQARGRFDASCRLVDVDADGRPEIIAPLSSEGQVLAFDAASGQRLWRVSAPGDETIEGAPWVGNLEGREHAVAATTAGRVLVIDAADGKIVYDLKAGSDPILPGPLVADVSGTGIPDVMVVSSGEKPLIRCIDSRDGGERWSFPLTARATQGPALTDLDADGAPDLAIATADGVVTALSARTGIPLWQTTAGEAGPASATVIADLDADGKPEVIAGGRRITALAADGQVRWSVPASDLDPRDGAIGGLAIADLDADGVPDVAFVTSLGLFRVLSGRGGAVVSQLDVGAEVAQRAEGTSHGVTIADLTGDGRLDVFLVVGVHAPSGDGASGMAVCLSGFEGTGRGWAQAQHDASNTGNAGAPRN
ncbi:MAG: FG-GAP-like repeat-containing protein [Phycisphaerales bacterium]